jgi:enoyl-CoA hydratase/carnithine racemase
MSEQPVLIEYDGPRAVITLNRPDARNAVNDALREGLTEALHEVAASDALVAILTGAGSAFCAGGDIKAMAERLDKPVGQVGIDGWRRQQRTFALTSSLHDLPQITIAAVNGAAAGLGMDLALACDFVVAADRAKFASSFIKRGLIPDGGSMYYLPRRVGLAAAKDLLFSGRTVEAAEALEIGLADHAGGEDALAAAIELSGRYEEGSAAALMLTKSIVNQSHELTLPQIAALGGQAQAISYTTAYHRESVEAFLAASRRS